MRSREHPFPSFSLVLSLADGQLPHPRRFSQDKLIPFFSPPNVDLMTLDHRTQNVHALHHANFSSSSICDTGETNVALEESNTATSETSDSTRVRRELKLLALFSTAFRRLLPIVQPKNSGSRSTKKAGSKDTVS